jgi:hypothetical protein
MTFRGTKTMEAADEVAKVAPFDVAPPFPLPPGWTLCNQPILPKETP